MCYYLTMKFRLWKEYGALNSKPVFEAFETSLKNAGHTIVDDINEAQVHVIWSVLFHGRMAKNKQIWDMCVQKDIPIIVLEVGGIQRGTTWKVGINGINRDAYFGPTGMDNSRAESQGLFLKPWHKDGDYVLICGQHEKSLQWRDMPRMSQWVMDTISQVQLYIDKPIIFRPHPRCRLEAIEYQYKNVRRQEPKHLDNTYDDFDLTFNRIFATINYSSNPGIHSVINGVPAVVGPSSLAYDVAMHHVRELKNLQYPDRQQWLNDYAWTEFTIAEIQDGLPLQRITKHLESLV